jgi:hypothetical protein
MLRKLALALAASAALGAAALSPTAASAHGWHGGGHWGHGGGWGHHYGVGFGFSPVYAGPRYVDNGCYATRRVRTAHGIRLRTVNACY